MKKFLALIIMLFAGITLVGCGKTTASTTKKTTASKTTASQTTASQTTSKSTTSKSTSISTSKSTSKPTTTKTITTSKETISHEVGTTMPEEFPFEDEVNITFWHIYGKDKSALLDRYIGEFETLYPNIHIQSVSQSDYDTLREKISMAIAIDDTPSMALGYPDHFAGYLNGEAVVALDEYINNPVYGVDIEDFVDGYVAENNQYKGGFMYSMPYSKSTEFMAYNKTVTDYHGVEIPHDKALSYSELIEILEKVVTPSDVNGGKSDAENFTCEMGMSFDSSSNLFINATRQFRGGYTNSKGEILVDNDNTLKMLTFLKENFQTRLFGLPLLFDQSYGSNDFKIGNICMTVGSTAGVNYNIPSKSDTNYAKYVFDVFEVGIAPIPQADNAVLKSTDVNNEAEAYLSAVQQGPNIGIFTSASEAERLACWYFIKYLTLPENTAEWAMDTGYLPVRKSGYTSDAYSAFMNIALKYWAGETLTPAEKDNLYKSMVANVAEVQVPYYEYDPAFAQGAKTASSSLARETAGSAIEYLFNGTKTPRQAIDYLLSELTWN